MSGFIDFADLKSKVNIEQVLRMLNLTTKHGGGQFRAPCPHCKTGGDRALAVTPAKNAYYCFAAGAGGDQIALLAHCRGISAKDAAQAIAEEYRIGTSPAGAGTSSSTSSPAPEGFKELDYLEAEHAAVEAVGFPSEVALALGIGFAPKGLLRGTVAIPVRLSDGTLAGYIGITEAKLPSKWHGITTNVVPLPKRA